MAGWSGDPQVHLLAQSRVKENNLLRTVSSWLWIPWTYEESLKLLDNLFLCLSSLTEELTFLIFSRLYCTSVHAHCSSPCHQALLRWVWLIFQESWTRINLMTPSQWQCVITPLSTWYCFCSQSGAVRGSRAVNSNVQAPISSLTCEYNWLYLPLSSSLFALLRNALNSFWFCFWTLAFCLSFLFLGTENLCRKSTLYSPCSRPKLCFSTEGRLEHTCRNIMSNYCSLVVAGLLAKMNRDIQPGQGIMKRILDQQLAHF